jgi:hypothetical protein
MASPLTVYIPIKQDAATQATAITGVRQFTGAVQAQFDRQQMVHFAALVLVPNAPNENGRSIGNLGILLLTDFDGPMDPYLKGFWDFPGSNAALITLSTLALDPVEITTLTEFINFFNAHNLTPAPKGGEWNNFYQAYDKTVKQIVA